MAAFRFVLSLGRRVCNTCPGRDRFGLGRLSKSCWLQGLGLGVRGHGFGAPGLAVGTAAGLVGAGVEQRGGVEDVAEQALALEADGVPRTDGVLGPAAEEGQGAAAARRPAARTARRLTSSGRSAGHQGRAADYPQAATTTPDVNRPQ